ncbi:hypothetical protein V502_01015 [Pseudogymnoascus sp. VKM F-4520 (FW-2644)]|nr:hypothetical protein V502_01015 [Pseudogymnoascus sp. VKM F-4520 (FW-2644)]
MLNSTRLANILYLRGTEQNNPDLHPLAPAGSPGVLTEFDSRESTAWQRRTSMLSSSAASTSSLAFPSQSSTSLHPEAAVHCPAIPMTAQLPHHPRRASPARATSPQRSSRRTTRGASEAGSRPLALTMRTVRLRGA